MDSIGIIGTIGTFIFGMLSIFLFFKSRRSKKPAFIYDYSVLQTCAHPEITILYNKEQIENLSKSRIIFFNNGTQEIRSEDVPNSKFPAINFISPTRILSYQILKTSSEEIGVKVKRGSVSSLEIIFDYLNPIDGLVLEVLYEAPPLTKDIPAKFVAPIKGAEPIVSYKYRRLNKFDLIFSLFMTIVWSSFGLGLISLCYQSFSWIKLISGVALISIGIIFLWAEVVSPLQKSGPKFATEFFNN